MKKNIVNVLAIAVPLLLTATLSIIGRTYAKTTEGERNCSRK